MRYRPMRPDRRLRKIIRDAEQLIRDVEWWNNHRTEYPPFDCEYEKVVVAKAKAALAEFRLGQPTSPEFNRLTDDLMAYMKASAADA